MGSLFFDSTMQLRYHDHDAFPVSRIRLNFRPKHYSAMIQRIQSVLLFLAAAINVVVLFVVLGDVSNTSSMEGGKAVLYGNKIEVSGFNEETMQWTDKVVPMAESPLLMGHMALVLLGSSVLLVAIFLYSNRQRQAMIVTFGIVLVLLQIVAMILLFQTLPDLITEPDPETHNLGIWMILPVLAVLLAFFARKRIQKDERMVRDMDRIR